MVLLFSVMTVIYTFSIDGYFPISISPWMELFTEFTLRHNAIKWVRRMDVPIISIFMQKYIENMSLTSFVGIWHGICRKKKCFTDRSEHRVSHDSAHLELTGLRPCSRAQQGHCGNSGAWTADLLISKPGPIESELVWHARNKIIKSTIIMTIATYLVTLTNPLREQTFSPAKLICLWITSVCILVGFQAVPPVVYGLWLTRISYSYSG